ncbi:hypothetical protein [Ramlibacter alkalitolerans]|uniref:Type 4 secretion system PilS N-terminal domain-containing protein n=1 Tax=Ramlibacter alkalitolerans TaxID=2039631 RepID=A0ABS1JU76_9BURK|nr:hypothetical protein [Ramlibacter alkalitolerans]MBL0427757.1 hypothetical protein [Ramlibacter alkalitolerans]
MKFTARKNAQKGSVLAIVLLVLAVIGVAAAYFSSDAAGGGSADKQSDKGTASTVLSQMASAANSARLGVADNDFDLASMTYSNLLAKGAAAAAPAKSTSAATPGSYAVSTNTAAADGKSHYLVNVDLGLAADAKAGRVCSAINEAAGATTALASVTTVTGALDANVNVGCVATGTKFTAFTEIDRI